MKLKYHVVNSSSKGAVSFSLSHHSSIKHFLSELFQLFCDKSLVYIPVPLLLRPRIRPPFTDRKGDLASYS